jgi:hypothetical protein
MSENHTNCSGGCGCVTLIATILVLWALWFGLPINDKKWNIDIFPPRIWDMNAPENQPSIPVPPPIVKTTAPVVEFIEF